jgi:hypothetical protein
LLPPPSPPKIGGERCYPKCCECCETLRFHRRELLVDPHDREALVDRHSTLLEVLLINRVHEGEVVAVLEGFIRNHGLDGGIELFVHTVHLGGDDVLGEGDLSIREATLGSQKVLHAVDHFRSSGITSHNAVLDGSFALALVSFEILLGAGNHVGGDHVHLEHKLFDLVVVQFGVTSSPAFFEKLVELVDQAMGNQRFPVLLNVGHFVGAQQSLDLSQGFDADVLSATVASQIGTSLRSLDGLLSHVVIVGQASSFNLSELFFGQFTAVGGRNQLASVGDLTDHNRLIKLFLHAHVDDDRSLLFVKDRSAMDVTQKGNRLSGHVGIDDFLSLLLISPVGVDSLAELDHVSGGGSDDPVASTSGNRFGAKALVFGFAQGLEQVALGGIDGGIDPSHQTFQNVHLDFAEPKLVDTLAANGQLFIVLEVLDSVRLDARKVTTQLTGEIVHAVVEIDDLKLVVGADTSLSQFHFDALVVVVHGFCPLQR